MPIESNYLSKIIDGGIVQSTLIFTANWLNAINRQIILFEVASMMFIIAL